MRTLGSFAQAIAARVAGALGLSRRAGLADRPGPVSADRGAPPTAFTGAVSERDLRDRERELRILMSNWM